LTKFSFDDRSSIINEHILEYERRWTAMRSIITSCPIKNENNGITRALREIAKCDEAKGEFLLQSLSSYYCNTVENIKAKEKYAYGDVVKLREYIPARQKGRKKETTSTGTSASGDQVVLSTNKNSGSGKTCGYCKKNKGWPGKGHEEEDCWTKKREEKNGQPEANKTGKDNESESENNSDDDMPCHRSGIKHHRNKQSKP
jgi:hypothetical protein